MAAKRVDDECVLHGLGFALAGRRAIARAALLVLLEAAIWVARVVAAARLSAVCVRHTPIWVCV